MDNEKYLQMNNNNEKLKANTIDIEALVHLLKTNKRQREDKILNSMNETELQIQDNSDEEKPSNVDKNKPGN